MPKQLPQPTEEQRLMRSLLWAHRTWDLPKLQRIRARLKQLQSIANDSLEDSNNDVDSAPTS